MATALPTTSKTFMALLKSGVARSRKELARDLGVSSATMTNAVNELLALNLVEDANERREPVARGRQEELLRVRAGAYSTIGVSLTPCERATQLCAVRMRLDGTVP